MEAVVARENMLRALRAVEGNAGQSGSVERDEAAHAANGGGRGRLIPCDPSHTVSMERRNASFMRDCQPGAIALYGREYRGSVCEALERAKGAAVSVRGPPKTSRRNLEHPARCLMPLPNSQNGCYGILRDSPGSCGSGTGETRENRTNGLHAGLLESRLHPKGIGQHLSHASARKPSPRVIRSGRGIRQKRI